HLGHSLPRGDDMPDEGNGGGAADNSKLVAHLEKKNADLERDNKKYRDRLRGMQDELKAAKPAEGAVVLSGDEAKRWTAFSKIEGDPADIAKRLDAGKAAEVKLAALTERERDREAAEAIGWKPNVLSDLRASKKIALEM